MATTIKSVDGDMLLEGVMEANDTYFRLKGKQGRDSGKKIFVFRILERKWVIKLEGIKDAMAETLPKLIVKMVGRGCIIYTNKFKSYDTPMFCGYKRTSRLIIKDDSLTENLYQWSGRFFELYKRKVD